jgi:hypothetical protein
VTAASEVALSVVAPFADQGFVWSTFETLSSITPNTSPNLPPTPDPIPPPPPLPNFSGSASAREVSNSTITFVFKPATSLFEVEVEVIVVRLRNGLRNIVFSPRSCSDKKERIFLAVGREWGQ